MGHYTQSHLESYMVFRVSPSRILNLYGGKKLPERACLEAPGPSCGPLAALSWPRLHGTRLTAPLILILGSIAWFWAEFRRFVGAWKNDKTYSHGSEPARSTGNCRFVPKGFILQAVWLETIVFSVWSVEKGPKIQSWPRTSHIDRKLSVSSQRVHIASRLAEHLCFKHVLEGR